MNIAFKPELEGLHWSEDGYAAISGKLLDWSKALDEEFLRWSEEIGAADHRYPTLIPAASLEPIAYLKSFPHLATFAVTADRNPATLKTLSESGKAAISNDTAEPVSQLLTPAACYHIYPRLAGRNLQRPEFLTTRCHCHRREEYYSPLQRQWCFEMRELVCLGDDPAVENFIADCRQRIETLAGRLGIRSTWEVATDPFFDPSSDPKALAQRLAPSKYELCLDNGLAIGSINRHRSFFGECYDIRLNGQAVSSACVAFGIERWLYAMVATHGQDISAWPHPGADQ
jgi:hypothetical protein